MVYIHGGGFVEGASADFNGTRLAMKGVVFVTINYRLDILGQFFKLSALFDLELLVLGARARNQTCLLTYRN